MEEPQPIYITTDEGERKEIEYKLPTEATKAVGVWQDLVGTSTTQVSTIIEKINQSFQFMERFPIPRHLVWLGLKQSLWKSIEYVLPATTMSRQDAKMIAKALYAKLLPKLGCNRNFPLLLRYNHPSLLGLGLRDPYLEQGLAKLQMFLDHGTADTISGQLCRTSLEHHQLEIGSFSSMFDLDYGKFSFLTSSTWITCLWEFVNEHNIQLISTAPQRPQPLRLQDRALMDIFCNEFEFPSK